MAYISESWLLMGDLTQPVQQRLHPRTFQPYWRRTYRSPTHLWAIGSASEPTDPSPTPGPETPSSGQIWPRGRGHARG